MTRFDQAILLTDFPFDDRAVGVLLLVSGLVYLCKLCSLRNLSPAKCLHLQAALLLLHLLYHGCFLLFRSSLEVAAVYFLALKLLRCADALLSFVLFSSCFSDVSSLLYFPIRALVLFFCSGFVWLFITLFSFGISDFLLFGVSLNVFGLLLLGIFYRSHFK